jgi:hypothetical protein
MKFMTFLLVIVLLACSHQQEQENALGEASADTLIGRKVITDEIAGSAYLKRAMAYFLIINGDTSVFQCILTESKEGGQVDMDLRFLRGMSYRQQKQELKKCIAEGAKDFAIDSLKSIFIRRLITTGDLAADVSRQLNRDRVATDNYREVALFLLKTKLTADFNQLLAPVNRSVAGFSVEKVFLTEKKILYSNATIESDSSVIPDRILDCITWIRIK